MAEISASLVKELRERTGAGMMECKKALSETQGDIEAAIELMRKTGQAKAAKKAGRIAAEGLILVSQDAENAVMAEVNCETDFVTKNDDFKAFCDVVVKTALASKAGSLEALLAANCDGKTVEELRAAAVAKIGENISVRRVILFPIVAGHSVGVYLHGARIGVLTELEGGTPELARDIAMHVAASRPVCVSEKEIDPALLAKEKEIYLAQAAEAGKGKPQEIIEKMVMGKVKKFIGEITLLGQPFIKDPDQSVEKLLNAKKATAIRFERFEVGEGIEKKVDNFVEEVMQQVKGNA